MEKRNKEEVLFCLISRLSTFEGNLFDKPQDRTDFKTTAKMIHSVICNEAFNNGHPSVKKIYSVERDWGQYRKNSSQSPLLVSPVTIHYDEIAHYSL